MRSLRPLLSLALAFSVTACASAGRSSGSGLTRLEQARAARPADAAIARSLGIAYYKAGRFDDARKQLDTAVAMNPRDGAAALYLGLTAEQQKDIPAAKAAYQGYLRYGRTSRIRRQLEARHAALTRQELASLAKVAVSQEQQLAGTQGSPRVVAVMPLRFVGSDTTLQPLGRGLAELITTDLARSGQLTVVERARMQALLDEMQLQQSGATDAATNVRAGKIIQAGRIVSGQIMQNEQRLRVDAAIVNTTTSQAAGGAANENTMDMLLEIEKNIVLQLFDSLGVVLTTAERNAIEQRPTRSMQAFLAYSQGLQFEDQGRFGEAASRYQEAVRIDPSFSQASQRSEQAQATATGMQLSAASIESNLTGTTEGNIAEKAQQGESSQNGGGSENSASNIVDNINESPAGAATSGASSGSQPGNKDAVSEGVGADSRKSGTFKIIVRVP
jgi:TolB-like protein